MQSKTEELRTYGARENYPRTFQLYEEYSHRPIDEVLRTRRENFGKADLKTKEESLKEVEMEAENFRTWLKETKNLEPTTAHYYSASLKSLLLGLPVGVQVAQLFATVLAAQTGK